MQVLVTGAAGFIGHHLCLRLLAEGCTVIGMDNLDDFYSPATKRHNLVFLSEYPHFHFYECDIRSDAVSSILSEHDIAHIVHLAGRPGIPHSLEHPMQCVEINVNGTISLLERCKDLRLRNFINASSSSVYGGSGLSVCRETDFLGSPISVYAAAKMGAELLCQTYHHNYGVPAVNVRLFSVYGPRGRPDQIVYKLTRMIDEGATVPWVIPEPRRDFTYVDDVTEGLMLLLKSESIPYGSHINLGYGEACSLAKLLNLVEQHLGKRAKIGPSLKASKYDANVTCSDNSRARILFDWKPKTDLSSGVEKFVEWYRKRSLLRIE